MRIVLAVAVLLIAGSARADIAYSNFLPNQTFVSGPEYSSTFLGSQPELGFRFTAGASGGITQIRAGLYVSSGGLSPLILNLWQDSGSGPVALLATWTANVGSGLGAPSVIPLDGQTILTAGASYDLAIATPPGSATWTWWTAGTPQSPVIGDQYLRNGQGPWVHDVQPMTAFEITVVPAPASALLTLAALPLLRRRRPSTCLTASPSS
jgi:hypothetical protein